MYTLYNMTTNRFYGPGSEIWSDGSPAPRFYIRAYDVLGKTVGATRINYKPTVDLSEWRILEFDPKTGMVVSHTLKKFVNQLPEKQIVKWKGSDWYGIKKFTMNLRMSTT